ncbi:MAG: Hsp20/alpha crystallin family protein [Planctomycetes bacterium]|nr:Hsp20/alpha crystallin family protein [Planctomycetota bacterium]
MSQRESRPEQGPLAVSVERLRHELDRWLEAAWSQGGRALNAIGWRAPGRDFAPAVDVIESPEEFLVLVDLPGCESQMLEVSLTGNMLTIVGQRPEPPVGEHQTLHSAERVCGRIERSIPMPAPVDPDHVQATCRDGVLSVRLMKSERAKARQIQIHTG